MTRDISEAQIRYITTTIRPATQQDHKDGQQSHQKIHLSPWDLKSLVRPYMQRGLLFANPKQRKQDAEKIITQLKTSLSCALDHFYPLAGRIATTAHDDNTVSFFIDCKPAGAEFVHASADVTIAEIMDSTHVPRIVQHSFFTLNDVVNYDGRSKPLLSIQVTELIDGFFVGCSINHTVCDGKSFWLFFNSWCEISRRGSSAGDQHISCLPIFDRSCLMNNMEKDLPIRFPLSTVESWQGYKYIPPPLDERVFIFTEENIAKLKAKANSNITAFALNQTAKEDADHKKVIISSLQAVLAHVWVAVTRARCLDPNEVTVYYLAIGATGRLNPPLPKLFFGNSSMGEAATAKVSELLEVGGFELGASLLNAVVRSFDDAKIRSFGKSWMKKPEVNKMDYYLSNNSLQTGGSPRFNMFGNDFGCGEPIAVRSGSANKCDGKITSTPGPVSGSIGIEACLSAKTLKALENDTEFMRYITI
ncbi:hypothetical protein C5167_016714 [Papaver somniferum]|uniref:uncharacterized acetyltransferase At3g50280-like n=1 Tax=Papaver somniferum TaxID=3469 RepID=UPI000E6FAA1D|nr:uncharacterized acetyltransferase At3g50280-like [Papaver somniferum]RZC94022.1 hypothetical protein C5167_016714 [Papaver somniferum]